jgi:hypothetical protein
MTYQEMLCERAADRRRSEPLFSALSDQLTISGQRIERVAQPEYRAGCIAMEDWPVRCGKANCDWLPFVRKQLYAIGSLPNGWDSYGAPSPDAHLVASAWGLIECLAQVADLPQPHVNPTRSGGVQFEWEAGERYFELEIVAECAAEYLYCDDVAHVEETGNVLVEEPLEQVLAYIRSVGTPK